MLPRRGGRDGPSRRNGRHWAHCAAPSLHRDIQRQQGTSTAGQTRKEGGAAAGLAQDLGVAKVAVYAHVVHKVLRTPRRSAQHTPRGSIQVCDLQVCDLSRGPAHLAATLVVFQRIHNLLLQTQVQILTAHLLAEKLAAKLLVLRGLRRALPELVPVPRADGAGAQCL